MCFAAAAASQVFSEIQLDFPEPVKLAAVLLMSLRRSENRRPG